MADTEREFVSRANVLVLCTVVLLVAPNPINDGDSVDILAPSLLLFSPSHSGLSSSFTGTLGVGLWDRLILGVVFGAARASEGGNVNAGARGTSSGFVNANELAKKFGTLLLFTPTFAPSVSWLGFRGT